MRILTQAALLIFCALVAVAPAIATPYVHRIENRTYLVDVREEGSHHDVAGATLEMQDNIRPLHLYVWVRVKASGFKPYRRLVQIFPYHGQREIKIAVEMEKE